MKLAGKYLLEKALLTCFSMEQYVEGEWRSEDQILADMKIFGFEDRTKILSMVIELSAEEYLEASSPIFRLTNLGFARRYELRHYMTDITFTWHDGRHVRDGAQVGCVWIEVWLTGVRWDHFPERDLQGIRPHLPLPNSLQTTPRGNWQIKEAIVDFARQTREACSQ